MNFGTSAVVRVGRQAVSPSARGIVQARGVVGGVRRQTQGFPASVRTGRGPSPGGKPMSARTRTGALDGNGNVIPGTEGMSGNPYNAVGPCDSGIDWNSQCVRPLAINPARTITAAAGTTTFTLTPCGPFKIGCIVVTESNALLFDLTSILVCRTNFLENGPLSAEDFSDQSNYACLLSCGSVFFPATPLTITVRNNSAAGAVFAGIVWGREATYCGN